MTPRRLSAVRSQSLIVVAVFALVVAACTNDSQASKDGSDVSSTSTTSAIASGAKVVAPDAVGPYKVGRRTIEMDDTARGRKLTVDVWYPADADATGAPSRYTFIPTVYFDSKLALDAPPIAAGAPFPLVVYSHGSGGLRYVASWFTELLASHGFVVIAPDHIGNTAVERIFGGGATDEENAANRVADVQFLITDMLRLNTSPGDPFEGSVDPARVGLTGHSFGGFTALAAPVGYSNAAGTAPADPRIKAVIAFAPFSGAITDEGLASLKIPTMLMTGTKDETTPIQPQTERPWEKVSGRPLYRVDIDGAAHQSFTDVCEYQRLLPKLPDVPKVLTDAVDGLAEEGCASGFLDVDRVHAIANSFAVSFLETEVAGAKGYDSVLSTDGAAAFPEAKFSAK